MFSLPLEASACSFGISADRSSRFKAWVRNWCIIFFCLQGFREGGRQSNDRIDYSFIASCGQVKLAASA